MRCHFSYLPMNDITKFMVVFVPIFTYLFTVFSRTVDLIIEIPIGFFALIIGYVILFLLEKR